MAEEAQQADAQAAGGGKKKLVFILLGAILLMGGSIAGTLLIVGGDSPEEAAAEAQAEVTRGDASYVDLKPPFTVNLAPEDPVAFLQISMQVLTFDDEVAEEVEKHKPLIRNNLLVLFGRQKSAELRAPEGKEKLQHSALETVQSVIDQHGSGGHVDNVFFTSFVMQ